jgi:hypothetical protein
LRVGGGDGLGELLCGLGSEHGDGGSCQGGGVVSLDLVPDRLKEGLFFVGVAGDLGFDALARPRTPQSALGMP